jgi:hypothetical protein
MVMPQEMRRRQHVDPSLLLYSFVMRLPFNIGVRGYLLLFANSADGTILLGWLADMKQQFFGANVRLHTDDDRRPADER